MESSLVIWLTYAVILGVGLFAVIMAPDRSNRHRDLSSAEAVRRAAYRDQKGLSPKTEEFNIFPNSKTKFPFQGDK